MDAAELPGDDIREMLRDSLRGFLGGAVERRLHQNGPSPQTTSRRYGPSSSGRASPRSAAIATKAGYARSSVVLAELGRAACPAPMWSAALANLALSTSRSEAAVDLLSLLHAGSARVAFSFGALDPDRGRGASGSRTACASGLLRFVEAAGSCTHLLVAATGQSWAYRAGCGPAWRSSRPAPWAPGVSVKSG